VRQAARLIVEEALEAEAGHERWDVATTSTVRGSVVTAMGIGSGR
jgi:hypothetical protein